MVIPLSIFLYIYLGLLLVFGFFAFFSIYHMIRFSFWDFTSFFATFLFIAVVVIILFISFEHIKGINWEQTFTWDAGGLFNFNLGTSGVNENVNSFLE